ncbi:NAD-dependent epimerase/dehydratase family protein [Gloeobacter kilaueensis]|uniref:NAD-dependent epimerase/dehydratase n=1 Tax=Gloeobacter kilaueensis (strain ATCC BAA-2537 / CCAP 1431/1 / ULC 316 / JS1) TaxID=1183438 RepID=U5QD03_GLOK1|nr:NAD-dependent epimerase/dehydratase family protein [Gloeobacter kilaueensis]AGY56728.1 NAD-dependent epimerase/dehydratase [Gloeobacter kilaueensis JS1]
MTYQSVVTGAAGFIGSHLCERLLAEGHQVTGIDSFTDYYDPALKWRNLTTALAHPNFRLIQADLLDLDCAELLRDVDYLFHQAAQAGVRASWGANFHHYSHNNIDATQVLLEAARTSRQLRRFVFASTSSIYGDAETFPTAETVAPRPVSPYGITKLAAERLGQLYWENFGVPFVALRYFSVYGPRQRPDMGFHKFIRSILAGREIEVYGDGQQTRDFTYVLDIVEANLLAALATGPVGGEVINVGGGNRVVLSEVLDLLGSLTGLPVYRRQQNCQAGDARHTAADITKAQKLLGFAPRYDLALGLAHQIASLKPAGELVRVASLVGAA